MHLASRKLPKPPAPEPASRMTPLRLVFMGTPDFAVPSLEALHDAGHKILCVYSQPPRRAGRGQKARPTPVGAAAEDHGIDVRTPVTLRDDTSVAAFQALRADIAVVVAYGLILPPEILAAPRLGCINAHASILPRWRGAAPIQRAIMAGDRETGVTIMQMDEGLDTGDTLLAQHVAIDDTTTAGTLHDELAALSGDLLVKTLAGLADGDIAPRPQPAEGMTYAAKILKAEARIDWRTAAVDIARQVNGLAPYPGAWFDLNGERVRILRAHHSCGTGQDAPGTVCTSEGLTIACGDGNRLRVTMLQRAGKSALDADTFLRGRPIAPGTVLSCPATD